MPKLPRSKNKNMDYSRYNYGMNEEDMSQPSNLPREVKSEHFGQEPGAHFDYQGNEHAMHMQAVEDKKDMQKQPAKRRY